MGLAVRAFARVFLVLLKNARRNRRPPLIFPSKELVAAELAIEPDWRRVAIGQIATRANARAAAIWDQPFGIEVRQAAIIPMPMALRHAYGYPG